MNMIERGRDFVQQLRALRQRTVGEWRRCPQCHGTWTQKHGGYWRHPWTTEGREDIYIARHRCLACHGTYSEEQADLVRGSWYARAVHRLAVDEWMHGRSSLRRVAERVRSWIGRQERWWMWHVWEEPSEVRERCGLAASTVHRWLDGAGRQAEAGPQGQLKGVFCSGQMGADGLWARFRQGAQGVLLELTDSVTGVIWAVVAVADESTGSWRALLERAVEAGLEELRLEGLTSDGASGLLSYLREAWSGVHHQGCVWHFWRSVAGDLARAVSHAVKGMAKDAAKAMAQAVRQELVQLLHAVLDAQSFEQAEQALASLANHAYGQGLAQKVQEQGDRLFFHLLRCHQGLVRIAPEWLWRDFRLRPSRGRNHGCSERLQRAGLLWQVYHDLTPAQWRSEQKRKYKHPGQSPLQVAGSPPGNVTYLDALHL